MNDIPWGLVTFIWFLNFGISWWNARVTGLVWVETKQIGGWQRFMTWMGGVMSASGFSYCFLILLLFGSYYAQFSFLEPNQPPVLTERLVLDGFSLGYVLLIPGILFSGMMIWIDSLVEAWKRRDLPSMGVAAWNTYAQVHNTYEAFSGMGNALEGAGDLFKGGGRNNSKDKGGALMVLLVVALVVLAIVGGTLLTITIVRHYAGTRPLPERQTKPQRLREQRA